MPSFDIVSEVDKHQLTNAVDQVNRTITNRFDFKGVDAEVEMAEFALTLRAESDMQVAQMEDMLRAALIKCSIDPLAMEVGDPVQSGKQVKVAVTLKNGLDKDLAKKIVKIIKDEKLKVQAAIQGDQVRVTGKKRDDLQQVIAMLRGKELEQPLQFNNFRD
ncbi:YajQ family cyclic di-GMP-binding protein [Microbulbifer sp. SA54]|uniref:YajQ family cyclic di-GMP-binding protein n=1 Tax=Microbulbifer sp. SA54 TaxID=3401577 RepID=UPI003AAF45F4